MRPDDAVSTRIPSNDYVGLDLDGKTLMWSAIVPIALLALFAVAVLFSVGVPSLPEGMLMP
jgi:hypothetical protein